MIEVRIGSLDMEVASSQPALIEEIVRDIGYSDASPEIKLRLFAALARACADQIGELADEVAMLELEAAF